MQKYKERVLLWHSSASLTGKKNYRGCVTGRLVKIPEMGSFDKIKSAIKVLRKQSLEKVEQAIASDSSQGGSEVKALSILSSAICSPASVCKETVLILTEALTTPKRSRSLKSVLRHLFTKHPLRFGGSLYDILADSTKKAPQQYRDALWKLRVMGLCRMLAAIILPYAEESNYDYAPFVTCLMRNLRLSNEEATLVPPTNLNVTLVNAAVICLCRTASDFSKPDMLRSLFADAMYLLNVHKTWIEKRPCHLEKCRTIAVGTLTSVSESCISMKRCDEVFATSVLVNLLSVLISSEEVDGPSRLLMGASSLHKQVTSVDDHDTNSQGRLCYHAVEIVIALCDAPNEKSSVDIVQGLLSLVMSSLLPAAEKVLKAANSRAETVLADLVVRLVALLSQSLISYNSLVDMGCHSVDFCKSMLDALQGMISDTDGALPAIYTTFLVDYLDLVMSSGLEILLVNLGSQLRVLRLAALKALKAYLTNRTITWDASWKCVFSKLLDLMSDTDLDIRNVASGVVARFPVEDALKQLLQIVDGKEKVTSVSAAEEAMSQLFQSETFGPDTLVFLCNIMMYGVLVAPKQPTSPGDCVSDVNPKALLSDETISRVVSLLERMVISCEPVRVVRYAQAMYGVLCAAPSSAVPIKLLRPLLGNVSQRIETGDVLVRNGMASLWSEVLFPNISDRCRASTAASTPSRTFSMVSSLLAVKMFPRRILLSSSEDEQTGLRVLLQDIIARSDVDDSIKRLAVESIVHCSDVPTVLDVVSGLFQSSVAKRHRLGLLMCCVLLHTTPTVDMDTTDTVFGWVLSHSATATQHLKTTRLDEDTEKLVMACSEALAAVLAAPISGTEVPGTQGRERPMLRCVRGLSECTSTEAHDTPPVAITLRALARYVELSPVSRVLLDLPVVIDNICGAMGDTEVSVRLEVLFRIVMKCGAAIHPRAATLLRTAVQYLEHNSPACRCSALKLLGALCAAREDIFQEDDKTLTACQRILAGLSSMDIDPQVRQMADRLHTLIFPQTATTQ